MNIIKFYIMILVVTPLTFSDSYSQADLNGKIFYGKATEITSSDSDKTSLVLNEIIMFKNGKIDSEILKRYSINDCSYSSEIDGRRAIAFSVIRFNASAVGHYNGLEVTVDFSGDVIGYTRLIGTIMIRYSDNSQKIFSIQAEI